MLAAVQNGDVDPNAMNWADISGAHGTDRSNADQTVTGITRPIQLAASNWVGSANVTMSYVKNGGAPVVLSLNGRFGPFVNGDTVHFVASSTAAGSGSMVISNGTTGIGTIDTILVSIT
jgi:hypothetical protein